MIAVTMTPTSWVQEMDTPPNDIRVPGQKSGKEKLTEPKGVKKMIPVDEWTSVRW
jgi:hypothetical protein